METVQTDRTAEEMTKLLKGLKVGEWVDLANPKERALALAAARFNGFKIVTRATGSGGFTATKVPKR